MKFSTSKALLLALSLTAVTAQAHGQNGGNSQNWPMNGQHGQQRINQQTDQRANPYDTPQINRNHQPHFGTQTPQNRPNEQWQAQHSRQAQKYGYEQRRDQRYGYQKPKNPYNNGINSPNHKFYRGGQLPAQYRGDRGQRYVIVDWRDHRDLYAPPVGMRWNYIDGRYILATIATGIIYNIIYGS